MSVNISIRERIEIRFCELIDGIAAIGNVFRFDMRGLTTAAGDALIVVGDDVVRTENSSFDVTASTLTLGVGVLLAQSPTLNENTMYSHNALVAAIEAAVVADRTFIEPAPSSVRLAVDSRVVERSPAPVLSEQQEYWCYVGFEVDYEYDAGNPYQFSTAIPIKTVTTLPTWSQKKLSA